MKKQCRKIVCKMSSIAHCYISHKKHGWLFASEPQSSPYRRAEFEIRLAIPDASTKVLTSWTQKCVCGMKVGILIMAVVMMLSACSHNQDAVSGITPGQSDLEYVQSKGTIVVGITDFAPLDYRDGEEWTGFDAELARGFAESLGVSLEFKEINWDKKTELLEKGSIDCIWNGMTMTEELQNTISCSDPYLSNAQVIVLRSGELEQYNSIEACQHLLFAVEAGSTGESLIKGKKYRYTTFSTQMEAMQSVSDKKSDATVIDVIMAAYHTGEGQEFDNLGFSISLNDEVICIGFRKDSDLTEKANEFLKAAYEDGTISSLAEKYNIEGAILD